MRALALILTLAALLSAPPALAGSVKAGRLTIDQAIVRASIGHSPNTAAYLVITNAGDRPDRLMSVRCACADKVDAHIMQMMNGMMMMDDAGPVEIPAHGQAVFAPGGRHLMLTGLKAPLNDGGRQSMVLVFEHAGSVTARFDIKAKIPVASPAPGH